MSRKVAMKKSIVLDFRNCTKLTDLYIRKNQIPSLSELAFIKNIQLQTLMLNQNPCDKEEDYRLKVISVFPSLKKLDDRDVDEDEREVALKKYKGYIDQFELPSFEEDEEIVEEPPQQVVQQPAKPKAWDTKARDVYEKKVEQPKPTLSIKKNPRTNEPPQRARNEFEQPPRQQQQPPPRQQRGYNDQQPPPQKHPRGYNDQLYQDNQYYRGGPAFKYQHPKASQDEFVVNTIPDDDDDGLPDLPFDLPPPDMNEWQTPPHMQPPPSTQNVRQMDSPNMSESGDYMGLRQSVDDLKQKIRRQELYIKKQNEEMREHGGRGNYDFDHQKTNDNILAAVLTLVKELDYKNLLILENEVRNLMLIRKK